MIRTVDRQVSRTAGTLGLRLRAVVAWGLLALALSSGLAALAYQLTRTQLVAERRDTAVTSAFLNARLLRNALRQPDPDISGVLSSFEDNPAAGVLARVGGEWYAGSVGLGRDLLPSSLREAVAAGHAARQEVKVDDVPHVVAGVAIPAADARYFELVPADDVDRTLARLGRGLMTAALFATAAGAGVGWYASGRVLRPLTRFAAAAERIAAGRFDTRVDAFGDPDLEALEGAFNRMADAVQDRIDREARFSSDVSHELRSPVAAMMSTIEIARRCRDDPAATGMAVDELDQRTQELHRLVLDLLELSRVEAGVAELQLEPVDPVQLAEAVLRRSTDSRTSVEVEGQVPSVVLLDKRRAGQMLQNLIDNAERYAGGVTRVQVSCDAHFLSFTVEDAGEGVPEHERSHIFERFARGAASGRARDRSGTGLGLSLVAEHAALHGGSVRLDDADGGGARFVVELPLERAT